MMNEAKLSKKLRSAREAAEQLGISKPTLCRLMQRGEISFYKVGSRVLFSDEHISAFLASCEHKSESVGVRG